MSVSLYVKTLQYSYESIERKIKKLPIQPYRSLNNSSKKDVKVGVISLQYKKYKTINHLIKEIYDLLQKSVAEGAQMVVFPEYTGMLLLPIIGCKEVQIRRKAFDIGNTIEDVKKYSDVVADIFCAMFSTFASTFNIYIMAGSMLIYENEKIMNRAFLFDFIGGIAGEQDKICISENERLNGVIAGSQLKIVNTQMGKIAILIGEDQNYHELFAYSVSQKANLILAPSRTGACFVGNDMAFRVNDSNIYALKSVLNIDLFSLKKENISGIFAPYQLTRNHDGRYKLSYKCCNECVVAPLDYSKLSETLDIYNTDSNLVFYQNQYRSIYKQ
ncbi:MAG: nitrilase-related carbon-nitrogen hydrolase [Oscillospiraceae bacterium]